MDLLQLVRLNVSLVSASGTSLNIHEDERMQPENWIPLGWLPIIDEEKTLRPGQGYEGGPTHNIRLQHECWRMFFSNWTPTFAGKHRVVIYGDGIARETMHFVAGLLGDQQVIIFIVFMIDTIFNIFLFSLLYLARGSMDM